MTEDVLPAGQEFLNEGRIYLLGRGNLIACALLEDGFGYAIPVHVGVSLVLVCTQVTANQFVDHVDGGHFIPAVRHGLEICNEV